MDVKGTAVVTVEQYVMHKAGQAGVDKWFDSLPAASRAILRERILATSWYPLVDALLVPTQAACDIHHGGDLRGAWDMGRHSAEYGLRGPYKVFLKMAPPEVLLEKGVTIIQGYYRPIDMKLDKGERRCTLEIREIDPPNPVIANRIAGWAERALQLGGNSGIEVVVRQSAATAGDVTYIDLSWT